MAAVNLDEIQARADAATPGPWRADDEHGAIPGSPPAWCVSKTRGAGEWNGDLAYVETRDEPNYVANAEFMAAARTDVPALIAEVRRLRRALQRWGDGQPCEVVDQSGDQVLPPCCETHMVDLHPSETHCPAGGAS